MNRLNHIIYNRPFWSNIAWFFLASIMAFFIWFQAVTSADPIGQTSFRALSVQIDLDDGLVITNDPTNTVQVNIRTQESVLGLLRQDDIIVRANLRGLDAGIHTVPLTVEIAPGRVASTRNINWDTQPSQITVNLELIEVQQKPVSVIVLTTPPTGFDYDELQSDVLQAEVRGIASHVTDVVVVEADVDLHDKLNPTEFDVRLIARNAAGQPVDAVELQPQTARISVNIFQRDDIQQVSVRPRIMVDTLPEGYTLSTIIYDPQTVFVGGNLETIEDSYATQPIDLTNHTEDFEVTIPIELPDDVFVIDGTNAVTVTLTISEVTTSRQIDLIPVEVIGARAGEIVEITPETVSIVLTGAISVLDEIQVDNIQIVVDITGLEPGNHEVVPAIVINQGQITMDNVTLLPSIINVSLQAPSPAAEETEASGA